ncbi:MAG: hypothetical protein KAS38_18660 [Anaerolineales bacterium]|nr:hypothetical protein [Anaerolineales bacterium]
MINKDGWAKNLEVVKSQWGEWAIERDTVVNPAIRRTFNAFLAAPNWVNFKEFAHKGHAWTEEIIDKNPRLWSYLAYPRRIIEFLLVVLVLK